MMRPGTRRSSSRDAGPAGPRRPPSRRTASPALALASCSSLLLVFFLFLPFLSCQLPFLPPPPLPFLRLLLSPFSPSSPSGTPLPLPVYPCPLTFPLSSLLLKPPVAGLGGEGKEGDKVRRSGGREAITDAAVPLLLTRRRLLLITRS